MNDKAVTMEFAAARSDIFQKALPAGFRVRCLAVDEAATWAWIETSVDEFRTQADAEKRFNWEFRPFPLQMRQRCFLLETSSGEPVGTASAWYDSNHKEQLWGRLHWVAIRPEFQGKGLARPLLSITIRRLLLLHQRAFLDSSSGKETALRLYLDFGFVPVWKDNRERQIWLDLVPVLRHPALDAALKRK